MKVINIKKFNDNAIIPTKAHKTDAGYDLYACVDEDIKIYTRKMRLIPTGVGFQIPEGYFGALYPRSGLATKQGLRLANCVGVIDSGYINQVFVPLFNDSFEFRTVQNGERIAQIIFQPYLDVELNQVNELEDTDRGLGGFGSSGIQVKKREIDNSISLFYYANLR